MLVQWNASQNRIDVQFNSTAATCKVDILFEGETAKRVDINSFTGDLLSRAYNCAITPGNDGRDKYIEFPLTVVAAQGFQIVPYYGSQSCPATSTTPFTTANLNKITQHHNKTYGDKAVYSATYHFQVALGDNVHITITIEDVVL